MTGVKFDQITRLDADCQKQDRKKMASYLEAATERFEAVIFKAASQLDLASLRDRKNMLLSEFLSGKRVFCCGKFYLLCKCLP